MHRKLPAAEATPGIRWDYIDSPQEGSTALLLSTPEERYPSSATQKQAESSCVANSSGC